MARAVLEIDGDTSGLLAALGAAESAAKKAEDAAKRTGRAYRDSAREGVAAERALANEANRAVAAHVRAEQQKLRAARMGADARKRAEQEATRIAQDEARKRGLSAEQEARVKQNALERYTRLYEAEERRQTVAAEREARKRQQAFQQWRRGIEQGSRELNQTAGRAAEAVARGASEAGGFAGTAIGMIRDARQARAQSDRALGFAIRGAGGSAEDVAAARTRARQFAAQTGISYEDVTAALVTGQERGSTLEVGEGQTRAGVLESALGVIRMANAENIDPGELLAARGRLGAAGLQGAALDEAIRMTIGAAQRGSVEVGQIIGEGLPGASQLMGQRVEALGPGASQEARQRAALDAYRESVALQEVAASTGRRAGNTANVLAAVNNALSNPRRQEQVLTNITTAAEQANVNDPVGRRRRDALLRFRDEMFERDPTREGNAMRLRAGVSPLLFSARLAAITGSGSTAANILAGTGHGNPQSFQANWRDLVAFLGGRTATGQTGGQRVEEMMGATVGADTLAEHQRAVEGDDLANFNRLEETRLNSLTTNTESINRLTDRIDAFNARNPLAAAGGVAAGGAVAATLGAKMTAAGAAGLLAAENNAAILRGRDVTGRQLSIGERAFRGATMVLGGLGGGGAGLLATSALGGLRDAANALPQGTASEALSMVQRAINDLNSTLRGGITATVSPTDAAHAATQAPSPPTPAR